MAGINTAGTPNSRNLLVGNGCLFLGRKNSTTGYVDADGYRHVGNVSSFTLTVEEETYEHRTSLCGGARAVDLSVTVSKELSGGFTMEEVLDFDNFALFVTGQTSTYTNPAVAGFGPVVVSSAVKLGRWYDIRNASGVRAHDLDIADVSLQETTSLIPVSLILGTDFEIDLQHGRVRLLATATNISAGEQLSVTIAADAAPVTPIDQVDLLKGTAFDYSLLFVSEAANDANHRTILELYSVKISADGELDFISEEAAGMSFTYVAQFDSVRQGTGKLITHADAHS